MSDKRLEKDPPSTKLKILKAAERLFVEKGFAASSLRTIAKEAGVNLAATHYHFGSKEGLYAATLHHCIEPINRSRLQALDQLESSEENLTTEKILEAFFRPLVTSKLSPVLPKLMARIYSEQDSLTRPILQGEFGEVMQRFTEALARQLPYLSRVDLQWRFHFMIGSMLQLLNFDRPMELEKGDESKAQSFERLLTFVTAGIVYHEGPKA